MLPVGRQRAPTGLRFRNFQWERKKKEDEKLLKGRRLTSLSEGRRGARLAVKVMRSTRPDFFAEKPLKSDDFLENEDSALKNVLTPRMW